MSQFRLHPARSVLFSFWWSGDRPLWFEMPARPHYAYRASHIGD